MISSIDSSTLWQITSMIGSTQQQEQGSNKMFESVDSSSDGNIDSVELSSFALELFEQTGIEIDTENAISTYDNDGDGGLNEEELKNLLDENGVTPPPPPAGGKPPMGMAGEETEEELSVESTSSIIQAYMEKLLANSSEDETELDAESLISAYDADGSGELNEEELQSMIDDGNFMPPPTMGEKPPMDMMGAESEENDFASVESSSVAIQAYLDQLMASSSGENDVASILMGQADSQYSSGQTYSPFSMLI